MKNTLLLIALLSSFSCICPAQIGLTWQYAGSDNIPGRVTSILVDKRDVTGQTVYIGTTGGGIWKSTNGTNTWTRLEHNSWTFVSCIAQAADGTIFFGTGGTSGITDEWNINTQGNGIYYLDANDNPLHLDSTSSNANGIPQGAWSLVNRIACNPNNANHLLSATNIGLKFSYDRGQTWGTITMPGITQGSQFMDVKYSATGNLAFASTGGKLFRSSDGGNVWSRIDSASSPGFPTTGIGRIEIATAPGNNSFVYISCTTGSGGAAGVYQSRDGGLSWIKISPATGFNPYGSSNTGWYSNTLVVSPRDSAQIFLGARAFYSWSSNTGWQLAANSVHDVMLAGQYEVGRYVHAMVFNPANANELYVGSDMGMHKSTDAYSSFPIPTFQPKNRALRSSTFIDGCVTQQGNIMVGSSDQGMLLLPCNANTTKVLEEDEDGCVAASRIFSDVYYHGLFFGGLKRTRNQAEYLYCPYDIKIDPQGYCQPSGCGVGYNSNAIIQSAFYLQETKNALNSVDSVIFTDTVDHFNGEVVTAFSKAGNYPLHYSLPANLPAGTEVKIHDPIKSRMLIASLCGVWISPDAAIVNGNMRWYRLAPVTSAGGTATCFTSSADGNTLWYGTTNGKVYKATGLNTSANYTYLPGNTVSFFLDSTQVTGSLVSSRAINGISADAHDPDILICCMHQQFLGPHLYKSTNGGASWTAITNGLPTIPVYDCLIDATNPNNYFAATAYGIYTSTDAGATWAEDNGGFSRTAVSRIHQVPVGCDTCYTIYAATFGRGMIKLANPYDACITTEINQPVNEGDQVLLYPNPSFGDLTIANNEQLKAPVELVITDMTGKCVVHYNYSSLPITISGLSVENGLYNVTLKTADNKFKSAKWVMIK